MSSPTTFWLLLEPGGHIIGSAYPEHLDLLVEDMRPDWNVEKVGRDEWDRRARPCLLGECGHRGAS